MWSTSWVSSQRRLASRCSMASDTFGGGGVGSSLSSSCGSRTGTLASAGAIVTLRTISAFVRCSYVGHSSLAECHWCSSSLLHSDSFSDSCTSSSVQPYKSGSSSSSSVVDWLDEKAGSRHFSQHFSTHDELTAAQAFPPQWQSSFMFRLFR